jgi:hypothetical protein
MTRSGKVGKVGVGPTQLPFSQYVSRKTGRKIELILDFGWSFLCLTASPDLPDSYLFGPVGIEMCIQSKKQPRIPLIL